jgi:SAM-dependent methyltransferase
MSVSSQIVPHSPPKLRTPPLRASEVDATAQMFESELTARLQQVCEDFRPEVRRRGIYRSWRAYRFLLRELSPHLVAGRHYVDLGAGAGVIPLAVASLGLHVTVLDTWTQYSPENDNLMGTTDEIIARFDRAGIRCVQWDLLCDPLPLATNCCDLLSLFDVLEHIPKPRVLLREVRRLLRPGGLLVIKLPNAANLRNRLRLLGGQSPHPDAIEDWFSERFFGHYREMTAGELERILPLFGFEVTRLKYSSACHWNTRNGDGFDRRFRINSLRQLAKFGYFGATALVPAFRYEILLIARKNDHEYRSQSPSSAVPY